MEDNGFHIDKNALESLFDEAIKKAAADLVRLHLPESKIKEAIEVSLKRLDWNDSTRFKEEVYSALDYACTVTIRRAIEVSEVEKTITRIANEYIASEEYQEMLRLRVIEAVKSTTLYVKPLSGGSEE